MSKLHPIQWKRGLFRLWVLVSVVWVLLLVFLTSPLTKLDEMSESRERIGQYTNAIERIRNGIENDGLTLDSGEQRTSTELQGDLERLQAIKNASTRLFEIKKSSLTKSVFAGLAVPLALLIMGVAISWVLTGFRRSAKLEHREGDTNT